MSIENIFKPQRLLLFSDMVTGIDTASFKLIVHRKTSIWIVYTFCIFSRSQESLNLRNAKKYEKTNFALHLSRKV